MSEEKPGATQEASDAEAAAFQLSLAALAQVPKAEIDALEAAREKGPKARPKAGTGPE